MALTLKVTETTTNSITVKVSISGSVAMRQEWTISNSYMSKSETTYTDIGEKSADCTFTRLDSGTEYLIEVEVYNNDTEKLLDTGYTYGATKNFVPTQFWARVKLRGNGGTTSDGRTVIYYVASEYQDSEDETYRYIDVPFDGSEFLRAGYELLGFSTSSSASSATYNIEDSITIKSTSLDDEAPTSKTLYAVWKKIAIAPWKWTSNVTEGAPFGFTAKEWNDFISYIKNYASINEISLSSTYLTNAKATKGNRMLASQANAMRNLLIQIGASPPAAVSSGSSITAAFINGLKDAFNNLL